MWTTQGPAPQFSQSDVYDHFFNFAILAVSDRQAMDRQSEVLHAIHIFLFTGFGLRTKQSVVFHGR